MVRETQSALTALAHSAADVTFGTAVLRGIFAGWLIAMVVWTRAVVNTGEIAIIVILTYVVGLAGLTHHRRLDGGPVSRVQRRTDLVGVRRGVIWYGTDAPREYSGRNRAGVGAQSRACGGGTRAAVRRE